MAYSSMSVPDRDKVLIMYIDPFRRYSKVHREVFNKAIRFIEFSIFNEELALIASADGRQTRGYQELLQ